VTTDIGADPIFERDAPAMGISGDATAPLKRPSRKLSLSSPILGFGKKDKTFAYEKITERNAKEREKAAKARAKEIEKEEKTQEKARLKEEAKREQNTPTLASSSFPSFALASRI